MKSNKNLQDALEEAKQSFPQGYTNKKISRIIEGLDKGYTLSYVLQSLGFNPMVNQLIYLGEATGSYKEAFEKSTFLLSEKTTLFFDRVTSYLQPTLILFISFILIWVVYALFYPLYENIISLNL